MSSLARLSTLYCRQRMFNNFRNWRIHYQYYQFLHILGITFNLSYTILVPSACVALLLILFHIFYLGVVGLFFSWHFLFYLCFLTIICRDVVIYIVFPPLTPNPPLVCFNSECDWGKPSLLLALQKDLTGYCFQHKPRIPPVICVSYSSLVIVRWNVFAVMVYISLSCGWIE